MESEVIEHIAKDRFWPLPWPDRIDGAPRRTGVEIEFAGLSMRDAAEIVHSLWGGDISSSADDLKVAGTCVGDVIVERDTALTAEGIEGLLRSALGDLVPIEVVTPPLHPDTLPETDRLVLMLRQAGARGTRDSIAFGFGVHLNPEVVDTTADAILPTVRAYGLLEDWLRSADPIDPSRRLLPFVGPWPRGFVDLLASEAAEWALDDLTRSYLAQTPTRNRGLDLLPLLEYLAPESVRKALPEGQAKGGRPTWHYRLPGARIDEPDWTIAYEWNRWCIVERVAARAGLLDELSRGWQEHRAALTTLRGDWARHVEELLQGAEIWTG